MTTGTVGQLARSLNKTDVYNKFNHRGYWWKNTIDTTGYSHMKLGNGEWAKDFDPFRSGANEEYVEGKRISINAGTSCGTKNVNCHAFPSTYSSLAPLLKGSKFFVHSPLLKFHMAVTVSINGVFPPVTPVIKFIYRSCFT